MQHELDRVHIEVRGLTGPAGAELAVLLELRLGATRGVKWSRINAVTGRVLVGLDPEVRTVADVLAVVRSAEQDAGTDRESWSRHVDLPGDAEPLITAALAVVADIVGFAAAVSLRAVPVPAGVKLATASLALVDAQPRLRRQLERHFGPSRTDALLAVGNAAAQAVSHGGSTLLVDAGQRGAALWELHAARESWRRWEDELGGAGAFSVTDPILSPARPRPLPAGPIERFADQAASGSLLAAGASLLGRQSLAQAADALLVAVPKASRTSRESFASLLSAALTRQGVLALDNACWRRLDRVSALVVDGAALRGGPPLVMAAEATAPHWSQEHLWSAGQRLLRRPGNAASPGSSSGLAIPPPLGRESKRLQLKLPPGQGQSGSDTRPSAGRAQWREVREDGNSVGRVLVGTELNPRADGLLAAARRAGLRVVLVGDAEHGELRSRADELIPTAQSMTGVVRRLQEDGHVVALLSATGHRALASADVGIGLSSYRPTGHLRVPWTADLVCPDLALAERVISATARARAVSERGRTLAMSASALGGLLLIAGPRRGAWNRAVSPVTGAALMGLLTGALAAAQAARPIRETVTPLVPWHNLEADEVLRRLAVPLDPGLVAGAPGRLDFLAVAGARAVQGLPPDLRAVAKTALTLTRYVREELADPLTPVLTVGAAASAILGAPMDAVLVGSVMGVNALVSALQRQRADRAMQAMRLGEGLTARLLPGAAARVIGAGGPAPAAQVTPAGDLRAGDVIALTTGDVVPADARLIAAHGLEVDESGLTGESVTVGKQVAATPGAALGDRACMVFEGAVVVAGGGRAVVVATGAATQAGRAVAALPAGLGPGGVQAQLRDLTDKALPLTLAGGALVSALGFLRGQRLRPAVADGVAVAVAAVPEGLPLVATVAQLAASRRLSRRGVLVRSSRTVEALGRVDTMCFDKTGTLTEGTLRLVEMADLDRRWTPVAAEQSPDARRLLRAAARACPQPEEGPIVHATDRAVLDAAAAHLGQQASHIWDPLEEMPFESNRGYAATLGQTRAQLRLVVKGAPEVLLPRCTAVLTASEVGESPHTRPLTADDVKAALESVRALASQGLRVLTVARRELPSTPEDLEAAVGDLTLMGFVGLADTPRPATLPVIEQLRRNNISVRMITGDHPVTARAIAEQLGIPAEHVVTGAELDDLDDTARVALIARANVFARVSPEHKVRIVEALRRSGRVVAMTGDGSNDAAAIRLADVGIGLATHGSAAARNAADLILTEPDLTLLLDALVEGRLMWQRVRDAVAILIGGNAGEVAFTVLGTGLSGKAPVGTRQFLLVNLLTDMFPAMAVALAHQRPSSRAAATAAESPAPVDRAGAVGAELAITSPPALGGALRQSIAIRGAATAAGASTAWLLGRGTGRAQRASTMGLVALVGTQLGQTVVLGGRSPLVWATVVVSGAVLIAVVQTPGVSQFFGCTPLGPAAWTIVAGSAAAATAGSVIAPVVLPTATRLSSAVVQRGPGLLREVVVGLQHQVTRSQ
ncbi:MAG: cation-translocating P-type ATPase [Mycobacteriales bacterium]